MGISLARNCSSSEAEVAFAGELEELVAKYQERSLEISGTGRGAHPPPLRLPSRSAACALQLCMQVKPGAARWHNMFM